MMESPLPGTPATFFQRSLQPDPWQAMFVDTNNLIWLPRTDSFEVWRFSNPASSQPWAPMDGIAGRYGSASPFGFTIGENGVAWLAQNPDGPGRVVISQGGEPRAVSTYAIDTRIANFARD